MGNLSEPQYFIYRLLVFGQDGTVRLKAYNDAVSRDRDAREMDDSTLALALDVRYAVNGGDYGAGIRSGDPESGARRGPRRSERAPSGAPRRKMVNFR